MSAPARPLRLGPACVAAALALMLAGCSSPGTRVILLPQANQQPSAVTVRAAAGGGETRLDQPYARATAPRDAQAAPKVDRVDPAQVQKDNPQLFALRPPPPQGTTLYFVPGRTDLTAESARALVQVIGTALRRPGADIVITGHTDTMGSAASNDALSLRRAEEIRDKLVERGFPADRIEATGRGQRELAVPTADNVDEARNRRVMVLVR